MTQWEFELKGKGHTNKVLESWKQVRQLAFITFMVNADPDKVKGMTVEQFMPLGADEVKKRTPSIHKRKDFKEIVERFR